MNMEQTTLATKELKRSRELETYYRSRAEETNKVNIRDFYYAKHAEQKMFTDAIETLMRIL